MKAKLKSVLRLLDGMYKEGVRGNKIRYPYSIIESLQNLEVDVAHLAKYVELYENDLAAKRAARKFNPENSEIRARLIGWLHNNSVLEKDFSDVTNPEKTAVDGAEESETTPNQ